MDEVEQVKSKVDLVEIISDYFPLKKAGRNLKAPCPFHSETNPSFMVSPDLQIWRCFGCGKGGDVFSFLEEKEGMSFPEALDYLAKKAGVKLQKRSGDFDQKKTRLYQINKLASDFFNYLLTKHKVGQTARDYLSKRKVTSNSVKKFELGYAPSSWDSLLKFLSRRKFDLSEIVSTGLLVGRGTGGFYDRFRGRLMFPIKSASGEIIGFSGRVLKDGSSEPKYINTPETTLFSKGKILYGLDLARGVIKSKNQAVLVEGEFDVIASFEAGVENTVATKGTALTENQVVLLSRLCDTIALCFDADLAGDAAARRGIELADQAGLNIKVIQLEKAKDPDELIVQSPSLWQKAIEKAVPVYDFLIDSALRRYDQREAAGKKEISAELLPIFSKISDEVVKAHYIAKLATQLEVSEEVLQRAIEKGVKITSVKVKPDTQKSEDEERRKGILGKNRRDRLEEYLLALLLQAGDFKIDPGILPHLGDFQNQTLKNIYKMFIMPNVGKDQKKQVAAKLSQEETEIYNRLSLADLSSLTDEESIWKGEVAKISLSVRKESLKEKLTGLSKKITQVQKQHQEKKLVKLRKQFRDLSGQLTGF